MKRFLIIFLLLALAVSGSQAQLVRGGGRAVRAGMKAASTSRNLMRNLEQQSRRAEQAARRAAAANRVKLKPSGIRIVPIPNVDDDDQKRENQGGNTRIRPIKSTLVNLTPLPKIKTLSEYKDERIAAMYDSIKTLVNKGAYLGWPYALFKIADYAIRHDDEQFAIACLEQVNTDRVTPQYLEFISRHYSSLTPFVPEISRAVAITAYCKMVEAKLLNADCDSARMQSGDTLLIVTNQFNPSLNPLVVLSCFYDPAKEVERYKEAADSVIATYDRWSNAFKDTFARDFVGTLINKGEYATVLSYFGRTPFKQFPDTDVDFTIDMLSCALATHNDSLATTYLAQAVELNPTVADEYWVNYFNGVCDTFIADPTQIELADWILENSPSVPHNALTVACELIKRYWSVDDTTWRWVDISDDSPEHTAARSATLHILDKGIANNDCMYGSEIHCKLLYIKTVMIVADTQKAAEADDILKELKACDIADIRCLAFFQQAYIAGHGLDHPKDALKILKKHIKWLDDPSISDYVREAWYDYMATLYTNLGKTKDAEKYRKLKEIIKNIAVR